MIALCVGHSRPGDSGAVSAGGISEHAFNCRIAAAVASILTARGVDCIVLTAYQGQSYGAAMKWLAERLRQAKATCAVELHFNAADNATASGHEWLYWYSSNNGRLLAKLLNQCMQEAFPTLPARGILGRGPKDRGADFLRLTPCPAVIAEPFFGSTESDWDLLSTHQDRYARVLADVLTNWKGIMS